MPLVRARELNLSYGHHVLLDNAAFQVFKGDRICLVGRNGAGKSTLLKLVEGEIRADAGEFWRRPGVVVARLEQELPRANDMSVYQVVASGLADLGDLLQRYHRLIAAEGCCDLTELARLQHELEARDGWLFQQKIDEVLSRLDLPADQPMRSLSGGWRRRVALARALVTGPDLLLLDEPTNHLDIETIEWLEKQLLDFNGAILFITHDRALVERLATKIMELDRGMLRIFECGYSHFLAERERLLQVEEQQNALFDKRLAAEEVWIRQGIKARRTRNEGRVRALKALREQRAARREVQGQAKMALENAGVSGKLVAQLDKVCFEIGGKRLIDQLTFNLLRGDKVGLLGPNGAGKSTLLKLLLGQLTPTAGQITLGTQLEVAYYDQMREQLDDDSTIVDTVGQGRDSISINGRSRHIMSYLADFLFSPERARTPLKALSGGERNRVQLACLFSQPANILVLDEPTNDLDVETLELLESILVEFSGTVILVSHDRAFMDNVVTSTLAFEGAGHVVEYVGGYSDWLRQGGSYHNYVCEPVKVAADRAASAQIVEEKSSALPAKRKLSYKEQRELDALPGRIEKLEQQKEQLQTEISDPLFYQQEADQIAERLRVLAVAESELEACYERWVELSD